MRPCGQPGCRALVTRGYCPAHARKTSTAVDQMRKRADDRKGEGRQFYSTPEWRAVRAHRLALSPFCSCGCKRLANTVDHVKPRRDYPELALDIDNTRSFFTNCHNRKTAKEDGGFGNSKARRGGLKSLQSGSQSRAPSEIFSSPLPMFQKR